MSKKIEKGPCVGVDIEEAIDKSLAQSRSGLKMVRVTKRESYWDGPHPNGIEAGYTMEGYEYAPPRVGERYKVRYKNKMSSFWTSRVVELLDDELIRTENSLYQIEYLE